MLDGVPAVREGLVLAPHILRLSANGGALQVTARDELQYRRIPLAETLEGTMAALYPALVRVIADCAFGAAHRFGPAPRTGHPCAPCRAWRAQYLPEPATGA
ncbi:hypothetical protein ACIQVO_36630 [Streptomyces sp. NPDC101062]|uniref:hypothetical protein n=1 Tax=unclassified Streptomyces TaxID=2593676 RepID=UPI003807F9DA